MQKRKPILSFIYRGIVILAVLAVIPRIITTTIARGYTTTIEEADHTPFGIVLAAETVNGKPSAILRDRLDRGVELYQAGVVDQLVMSGRNPEPGIMRDYAIEHGVPEEDILLDDGGIRTYATCYNAHTQMGLDEAIFVTQPYHLPRTLFLCRSLGIDATGVAAHHGVYWFGSSVVWNIRETMATVLAFIEIYISPPNSSEYATLYQEGIQP